MKLLNKILFILTISALVVSCADEFIETEPTSSIPVEVLITDIPSAQSALNGLYSAMSNDDNNGVGVLIPLGDRVTGGYEIFMTGMYADDLAHIGSFPSFAEINGNDPALNNIDNQNYWDQHYAVIYRANTIINQVPDIEGPEAEKNEIIGQAKAVRAFMFYKLVKVYGGVPLETEAFILPSDIDANPIGRSSVEQTYAFILDDVTEAVTLLNPGGDIYFFNEYSARVLKSKIEMELEDYATAKITIEPVIGEFSLANRYSDLFTGDANSQEAILAVDFNETDGGSHAFFFLEAGRGEVGASDDLVSTFEADDERINFISDGEIIKYTDPGTGSDDAYIFRYADVLLMYAELLAREDDPMASDHINQVRERAGLGDITLNSSNFIELIAQERRVEFFAEGSDRLFTITRLGIADDIISNKPNVTFIATRNNLWPIPQQEIERNTEISINDQNPGY